MSYPWDMDESVERSYPQLGGGEIHNLVVCFLTKRMVQFAGHLITYPQMHNVDVADKILQRLLCIPSARKLIPNNTTT